MRQLLTDDASNLYLLGSELLGFGFPAPRLTDRDDLLYGSLERIQERENFFKKSRFNYMSRLFFFYCNRGFQ